MTLNQTWKNCLRMWKWIASVWKPGNKVDDLKIEWLNKHKPQLCIDSGCFFCEYHVQQVGGGDCGCTSCPGKLVNVRFNCQRKTYHYSWHPKKFYQKLLFLDTKRRNNG